MFYPFIITFCISLYMLLLFCIYNKGKNLSQTKKINLIKVKNHNETFEASENKIVKPQKWQHEKKNLN